LRLDVVELIRLMMENDQVIGKADKGGFVAFGVSLEEVLFQTVQIGSKRGALLRYRSTSPLSALQTGQASCPSHPAFQ
jgi:hypothetical protein